MKKFIGLLLVFSFLINFSAKADEGMWLPLYIKQLIEKKMQKMGLKLSADDIYSVNHASLKDAVMSLGGFCTAEVVSDQGLLFTNHHCSYDLIAKHSTMDHDYLDKGFWARTKEEELPNPGLTAKRLVRMEDVTKIINDQTQDLNDAEKQQAIAKLSDSLSKAATEGTHYEADVKSFFYGNEYYLLVYEVFKDVRLVGAPPSMIGKFGGDTDNWMWPRHTGDFSVLRIYTDKDGNPAEYSPNNIPYKPKYYFPISLKGYNKGDFSMIMGFPGNTERYLSSRDIKYKMDVEQPTLINIFDKTLSIMKTKMDADPKAKIEMASNYASLANYYKYLVGQLKGLKDYDLVSEKKEEERNFLEWVNNDASRTQKYGDIFSNIDKAYDKYSGITPGFYYLAYGIFRLDGIGLLVRMERLKDALGKDASDFTRDQAMKGAEETAKNYFRKNYPEVEKEIIISLMEMMAKNSPGSQLPPIFKEIQDKGKEEALADNVRPYLEKYVFGKTFLLDSSEVYDFLDNPKAKKLEKDPLLNMANGMIDFYRQNYINTYREVHNEINSQIKVYIEGLRKWKKDKNFYPDANSTLRLTYGSVEPYKPRDAVKYKYYTTYLGILQKDEPGDPEFDAPQKLLTLLKNKDFGRYATNDTLRICFLSNNDITGGNSGSPVIDANGNLIGLAFDGNWESMTGDLLVDPKYNRTISVDVRYVLFIIDKYANAQNIMKELKLVD